MYMQTKANGEATKSTVTPKLKLAKTPTAILKALQLADKADSTDRVELKGLHLATFSSAHAWVDPATKAFWLEPIGTLAERRRLSAALKAGGFALTRKSLAPRAWREAMA